MTETPIKIPKWLSARVYNLNLVPDAVGYDEMRHYSAEDIVWLLNQIRRASLLQFSVWQVWQQYLYSPLYKRGGCYNNERNHPRLCRSTHAIRAPIRHPRNANTQHGRNKACESST